MQESFGASPHRGPGLKGGSLTWVSGSLCSQEQSGLCPMNYNQPRGQTGWKMNKSVRSLYLWDPYFWSKKINQTAQPIISAGCEEWVIQEVKTLVVFTKWNVIAKHSFWHRLPEKLEMVQSYVLPYLSPRLMGYHKKNTAYTQKHSSK